MVAMRMNAGSCAITATCGDFQWGCTDANSEGSRRIRPIAYQVRVVALAPAFEFAMAEFTMARKTNQAAPHTMCPRPSHGSPSLSAMNPFEPPILSGPKNTVAAYVVRT